jgi:hypothetical protein
MLSELWSKLSKKASESFERLAPENASVSVRTEEQQETRTSGITFAVDSVTLAKKPIWTEALAANLARRLQRKVLILPEQQRHVINAGESDWVPRLISVRPLADVIR